MYKSSQQQKELTVNKALIQAIYAIGDRKTGIISAFGRLVQYYDDPKFFQYSTVLTTGSKDHSGDHGAASGFSFFSRELAVLKCLCESLERYALENVDNHRIVYSPKSRLDRPSVPIESIVNFSEQQRKTNSYFAINPDASYGWVLGKSLPSGELTYIPAQNVYLLYYRKIHEPMLRVPISTGAACGTTLTAALCRGIDEVIERDAFMITYLNQLPRSRVAIESSKDSKIRMLLDVAHRYNLELTLHDITTDLKVYTFLAALIDRTGLGPAVIVGMKSGLDPQDAMLGALQEVFHPRIWLRREIEDFIGDKTILQTPTTMAHRGILWGNTDNIPKLNFLLRNNKPIIMPQEFSDRSTHNALKDLDLILTDLASHGCHTYYVDITPDIAAIRKTRFKVVNVFIPELQPLYLDERWPYLGGTRLYNVPVALGYRSAPIHEEDLNNFPHPFI